MDHVVVWAQALDLRPRGVRAPHSVFFHYTNAFSFASIGSLLVDPLALFYSLVDNQPRHAGGGLHVTSHEPVEWRRVLFKNTSGKLWSSEGKKLEELREWGDRSARYCIPILVPTQDLER